MRDNPSSAQVQAAKDRLERSFNRSFEVDLNGWRTVYLRSGRALSPEVLLFQLLVQVPTPYLPGIRGVLAVSEASLETGRATYIEDDNTRTVGFKPNNDDAREWLRLQFARARGMRYREHHTLDPEKIVYTRDP